ncbi:MAG: 4-hydroxy-tetrahydrodipicolinate reductase [Bacteroidia bacterium]|nr:4-hydroxy-tetrahydrodipicolinate reductase [Bacteroidia bacterium]
MNIALIGYGKMGKTIEAMAEKRGHKIKTIIDPPNGKTFNPESLNDIDVAIEFTRPEAAPKNILHCIEAGVPIVSGTTGWLNHIPVIKATLEQYPKSALFYASNFSLGVNVFFELNRKLADLMNSLEQYNVQIEEIHHTQKLDAPSGTAITLAEGIIEHVDRKSNWINEPSNLNDSLEIISKRVNKVPGTHSIKYSSEVDDIEIIHTAHSRTGFALGAIIAAEWTIGKTGFLSMQEMLNL